MIFDIFRRKKRPGVVKFDDTNRLIEQIVEVINRNRTTIRKNKIDRIF